MEALKSSFLHHAFPLPFGTPYPSKRNPENNSKSNKNSKRYDDDDDYSYSKSRRRRMVVVSSSSPSSWPVKRDPWSLREGEPNRPKPKSKNPKNSLPDDNARRIIKAKAVYLSTLRRNQGSLAQTPRWIKRTPEQMAQYLVDDRHGHIYDLLVVAAIRRVRSLTRKPEGSYDIRQAMSSFVTKLSFRDMCTVLKELRYWREVRDFFSWMKLQLSYRPTVIAYTIVIRTYGHVGKIKLAEQTFLEMLEAGCEPDEVACGTLLCAYARWGRHKAMLSFHSAVQQRGIPLSPVVFNFMLSSLQKKSLHGNVIDLWTQMVNTGGVMPNHFTYTVAIISFAKEGLAEQAFQTFKDMKNVGFVPEELTYSLLINLSSKMGNRDVALALYQDMRSQKIIPSNFTCASLLTLHYKNGDYSKALSLFSEMERYKIPADEVIYGLLIRIYGRLGLYEDAQKTFSEIEKLGLLTDEKTYITMAQVHLNEAKVEKALGIMEQMRSKNILFSRFAFTVLLKCYVVKEDLASAEDTFWALSKTGLPDSGSCNDMLGLYMKLRLAEKAKGFVIKIKRDQVKFDEELLKKVMKVYCREGMLREAEQLMEELSTSELFKDNKFIQTLSMAMHGESRGRVAEAGDAFEPLDQQGAMAFGVMFSLYLADGSASKIEEKLKLLLKTPNGLSVVSQLVIKFIKEGDISKAEYLYELLIKLGCKPEQGTTAYMISLYGKKQKLMQAKEAFAAAATPTAGKPLYNSMFEAYAKCSKLEEAYLFYKQETEKGNDVGAVAISILVNNLTNCGKHREAENVIRDSFHDKLELDTVAYNTFIKAMLKAGRLHFAASIYEHMLSSGVAPSILTFNTMISVHGRGRNLRKAIEMLNVAQAMGVALDEKAYGNMIFYYGKAGKSHDAYLLFCKMREEGIKPGLVSYNIMMNVYAVAGLYCEAEELFQGMRREGCSPDSFTYLSLVRAYTVALKYSEAEETINSMQKGGGGGGIPASCAHFNLLLSAYAKADLVGEAERVYRKIIEAGLSPDLACSRSMVRGYMEHGHVQQGIYFFERISGGGVEQPEADMFIMSAAVHLYRSAGMEARAEGVLNSMDSLGIPFLKNLEIGGGGGSKANTR